MTRREACTFHAKADDDLREFADARLPAWRRTLRNSMTAGWVALCFGPPLGVPVYLLAGKTAGVVTGSVAFLVVLRFVFMGLNRVVSPQPSVEFSGSVEDQDYGPDDVVLVDGKYRPRARTDRAALP